LAQGAQPFPQSTPVSIPFLTPSLQVGTWQVPLEQTWLWQSVNVSHAAPFEQAGHAPPPQSTPVSEPFVTASLQDGAWQIPPVQTPF
jgi:hypothetical protein